jgi:hypothetical protein
VEKFRVERGKNRVIMCQNFECPWPFSVIDGPAEAEVRESRKDEVHRKLPETTIEDGARDPQEILAEFERLVWEEMTPGELDMSFSPGPSEALTTLRQVMASFPKSGQEGEGEGAQLQDDWGRDGGIEGLANNAGGKKRIKLQTKPSRRSSRLCKSDLDTNDVEVEEPEDRRAKEMAETVVEKNKTEPREQVATAHLGSQSIRGVRRVLIHFLCTYECYGAENFCRDQEDVYVP